MTKGDRVKYIGLSVQVAQPGELGVVCGTPDVNKSGANIEVAWDLGGTSFCWPAELELVDDGPVIPAPDGFVAGVAAKEPEPDFDSYRRVQEDIAAMDDASL